MPDTSCNEAGEQQSPDCDYLKNLILEGRMDYKVPWSERRDCSGMYSGAFQPSALQPWRPATLSRRFCTNGFSLDFGNCGLLSVFVSCDLGYIHSLPNSSNLLETDIRLPHSHIPPQKLLIATPGVKGCLWGFATASWNGSFSMWALMS